MVKRDIFDKKLALKFIGRKFQKVMGDMTQTDLSKKSGIPQSNLNLILNGDAPVSRDRLGLIAKALGISDAKFSDLIVESKIYEIEQTSGKDLGVKTIQEIIEDEYNVNDPEDIKKILDVITAMTKK